MAATCLRSGCLLKNRSILAVLSLHTRSVLPQLHENTVSALIVSSQLVCVRHGSIYNKKSAEDIWNSVTGVSSQGRKRGRASRGKRMQRQNLNMGLMVGKGQSGVQFPGLSIPLFQGSEVTKIVKPQTQDLTFKERLAEVRSQGVRPYRSLRKTPLQRGWTGHSIGGVSIGPPDPVEGYTFDGFDTRIIVHKKVATMTKSQGNTFSYSCLVVTGNRNGLVGFAVGKSREVRGAMRVAKNKAAQHLIYVDRFNGHTLYHNFYEKYHKTSIIAEQKPKGHGLVCHRAIQLIAELAGIKDMYCKTEGRVKNYLSLTKAFFNGLNNQLTHQDLANKTGYNVVEYRGERRNYPVVVASPTEKKDANFVRDENFDYENYFYDGRVPLQRKPKKPPHYKLAAYKHYLSEEWKHRNQRDSQIQRHLAGIEPKQIHKKKGE